MAITAEELRILVKAETKKAVSELNRFKKSSQNTTVSLKDMAKKLIGPLSITAGILLMTKLVKGAVSSSIRYAASVEQITVSFTALLKSADKAQKTLSELKEFSIKTPFTFEELAPAAQRLIAFGTAAEDVVDTMKNLGNAAQGNSETLGRLVDAYGKVQAKGRASLEEINRFTEAGVPLMRQLAEDLGLTNEELFKFVSAGKVGFAEVDTALRNLTTGEGQFAGMLEEQSETLNGALSTLKGSVQELGKSLVEDLIPFLTIAVQKLTALINLGTQKRNLEDIFKTFLVLPELTKDAEANMGKLTERLIDLAMAEEEIQRILDKPNRGMRTTETKFTGGLSKQQLEQKLEDLKAFKAQLERIMTSIGMTTGGMNAPTATTADGGAAAAVTGYGTLANILRPIPDLTAGVSIGMKLAQKHAEGFVETMKIMNEVGIPRILRGTGPITEWERAIQSAEERLASMAAIANNEALPAMMTSADLMPDLVKETEGLQLGITNLDRAFLGAAAGADLVNETLADQVAAAADAANEIQKLTDKWDEFDESMISAKEDAITTVDSLIAGFKEFAALKTLDLLRDVGQSMTEMGEGVKTAADAWDDFKSAINAAMPQLLFSIGVALIETMTPWGIGIGLAALAASGLWSYFNGRNAGTASNASRSTSSTPSPDALIARTYQGETTYIHMDGSVYTTDERESEAITAVAKAAGRI